MQRKEQDQAQILSDISILIEKSISSYRNYLKYRPDPNHDFPTRLKLEVKSNLAKNNMEMCITKISSHMQFLQTMGVQDPKKVCIDTTIFKDGTSSYSIMEKILDVADQKVMGESFAFDPDHFDSASTSSACIIC